jgi:hypothetical protein
LFAGSARSRELDETRAAWENTERAWRSSPLAALEQVPTVLALVHEATIEHAQVASNLFILAVGEEKREILKSVTSNLIARQKEVVFPMHSLFAELHEWTLLNYCDPTGNRTPISAVKGPRPNR